jgi:hypothetical protein
VHIYKLTPIGSQLARSTSLPDNLKGRQNYLVISHLDKRGKSTPETIAEDTKITGYDLAATIRRLKYSKPPIIVEEGSTAETI